MKDENADYARSWNNYIDKRYNSYLKGYENEKPQLEKDEEILDNMDIKTIESYLRKKKLKNINK